MKRYLGTHNTAKQDKEQVSSFYPEYTLIEHGETLPMEGFVLRLTDMVYDPPTDTFTALKQGSYRFSWSIPAAAAQGIGIRITLEDDDAGTLYASFGVEQAQRGEILLVQGSSLVEMHPGNQAVFRNRSGAPIAIGRVPHVQSGVSVEYDT